RDDLVTGVQTCALPIWLRLGALHTFSLAEARDRARALRQLLADGVDPLAQRETDRRAKLAEAARTVTFQECAKQYLNLHEGGWEIGRASCRERVYRVVR